eukprot:1976899-Pyramimonas_sp.AAC.1
MRRDPSSHPVPVPPSHPTGSPMAGLVPKRITPKCTQPRATPVHPVPPGWNGNQAVQPTVFSFGALKQKQAATSRQASRRGT